jgi:hypothetical protein
MSSSKQTITVVSVAVVFALGIGVAIGFSMRGKGLLSSGDKNNNTAIPVLEELTDKSIEELSQKLSEVMLPENEFNKLESAIFQAGMGLFMAQSQAAGLTVNDEMQAKLKKVINDKYNRKYFSDMNAGSMTDLSKEDLIAVISFYHTTAGQKFLEMSPKIIQTTMSNVQADLSAWLPKTVEALVAELKGGDKGEKKEDAAAPEEKKAGENS